MDVTATPQDTLSRKDWESSQPNGVSELNGNEVDATSSLNAIHKAQCAMSGKY